MHKLTDNNEFVVRPFDARWEAILTFYSFEPPAHASADLQAVRGDNVTVRVVSNSPDAALAKLWAEADDLGYW